MYNRVKNVAVVLLNWNGVEYLRQFLGNVVERSKDAEIVLADNGSADDSVAYANQHFPEVKIIKTGENLGFAGGYNRALKSVEADYYILLNTDIEVTENWLAPLIETMESDELAAACQPKVKSFRNRSHFEHAGAAGGFIDKWGYTFCRGRIFDTVEEDSGQYDGVREIFWATGACLCIRADLFHSMGGFDGRFFAHMEEIDLCWQLKNRGYRIRHCPASTVYHVGGGALDYASPKKTYLNFRNNLLMMHKNMHVRFYWLKLFLRLGLDQVAAFKFLMNGQLAHFLAVIKAHLSFLGLLPKYTAIRRSMKKKTASRQIGGIYRGSLVADYFLRGKKRFSQLDEKKFT